MSCCGSEKKETSILKGVKDSDDDDDLPLSEQLSKGIKVVVLGEMNTGL